MAAWYGRKNGSMFTAPLKVAPTSGAGSDLDSGSEESDQEVNHQNSDIICDDQGGLMTCEEHPALELDLYCTSHDTVVCRTCAGLHHRYVDEINMHMFRVGLTIFVFVIVKLFSVNI